MKQIFAILLSSLLTQAILAQDEPNAGIIYGNNHAFSLTAPTGWILDNESGVEMGLHAVFYKQGDSWAQAQTVMYANTASLEDPVHNTLQKLIDYDLQKFKSSSPELKIEYGQDIKLEDGTTAKVVKLSGDSHGNNEAIAYIDADKTGILIVMSSRSKSDFSESFPAFQELVQSYFFISDEVNIEKN